MPHKTASPAQVYMYMCGVHNMPFKRGPLKSEILRHTKPIHIVKQLKANKVNTEN